MIEPPKIFTPRVYQEKIRNFILDVVRGNVFASPGTGKTGSVYDAYDLLRALGEAKRLLVLGPKRVAKNVWPAEQEKWGLSFGHLRVAAAIGTPDQRTAAVRSKPDILCLNYDNIEWLVDGYGNNGEDWPFDMVAADESTFIKGLRIHLTPTGNVKGQGSVRAKALARIAHGGRTRRWINLTGSPTPNGIQDIWGQQWFVDGGKALGGDFKAFSDRWFHSSQNPDGYTNLTPYAHSQKEIERRIQHQCLTIDARDYFNIKAPIERVMLIDLPPKVRREYDRMEKELFANINDHAIEVFTAGSKANKLLQLACGSIFYEEGMATVAHDEKLDMLKSIVAEFNGAPILVRYLYKPDKERILAAFRGARFLDDKKETEDAWNRGEIPVLVAHGKGAGHGLSLQHGGYVLVDYGTDFNLEHDEQIIERIGPTRQIQSGYDRAVYRYRIVARDTIEEDSALPRIKFKMSVQDAFKLAMKKRG